MGLQKVDMTEQLGKQQKQDVGFLAAQWQESACQRPIPGSKLPLEKWQPTQAFDKGNG